MKSAPAPPDSPKNGRTPATAFQQRLGQLRFFDPACGCGNFLIIAYREYVQQSTARIGFVATNSTSEITVSLTYLGKK